MTWRRLGRGAAIGYVAAAGAWIGLWAGSGYLCVTALLLQLHVRHESPWFEVVWALVASGYGFGAGAWIAARMAREALAGLTTPRRGVLLTAFNDHVAATGTAGWIALVVDATRDRGFAMREPVLLACVAAGVLVPLVRRSVRDEVVRLVRRVVTPGARSVGRR